MRNEFTAVIEQDGPWYIAYCAEVPGANGQGETREACLASLRAAIVLILEHRREESLRSVPPDAKQELVVEASCLASPPSPARLCDSALWENPQTGHAEAVPRHVEIANLLARRICLRLSIPAPFGES